MGFLLRHELSRIFRTRRAFWTLVAVVALSSLAPLWKWPTDSSGPRGRGEMGSVFLFFFWTQLAASVLAVPVFAAGAIAGERERGTYDLLRATPLSPAQIVLPKLLACTAYVALLLVATAPSACALFFLGGLDFETIFHCYVVTFAVLASASAICLAASLRADRTARAAVRGIWRVALWNSGPFVVPVLISAAVLQIGNVCRHGLAFELGTRSIVRVVATRLWGMLGLGLLVWAAYGFSMTISMKALAFAPYTAIAAEVGHDAASTGSEWAVCAGYSALVALAHVVYILATAGAAEDTEERSRSARFFGGVARRLVESDVPRSILTQVFIDLGGAGTPLLRNPVFLKEVRCEFHGGVRFRRRIFWGLAVFLLLLGLVTTGLGGRWMLIVHEIAAGVVLAIIPAVAGTSISSEIERGNLDLLRSTLLSPGAIVCGKLLASLSSCVGILCVVAGAMFFSVFGFAGLADETSTQLTVQMLLSSLILVVTLFFAGAAATLASLVARRSLPAILLAYSTVLGILVLVPAGLMLAFPQWSLPVSLSPFFDLYATVHDSGGAVRVPHAFVFAGVYLTAAAACIAAAVCWLRKEGGIIFSGK